ncbi:2-dehydro-3-deoxygalactonokinase [Pluralibacter gergoviae]|uniref:2-dehydro-3-deoxygalactonokinase n=1 Tax=Pluralibacter gergoviae TaxID=61647 RepID=UPI003EDF6C4C
MLHVTVDAGTTNTRVRIWKNNQLCASSADGTGIRDAAAGGGSLRGEACIKALLDDALGRAKAAPEEIGAIVASGMITSDLGLCPLPHLTAPVTLRQLAAGAQARLIPQIAPVPIWFIPGIKNAAGGTAPADCDAMDMMRGEEVEVFGLLRQHPISGPALIVLPGSHTKLVRLDEEQRIAGCATTMAGEVLDVLTHRTVLAHSLREGFAQQMDDDYLLQGADLCRRVGITRAAFAVRILDSFTNASDSQRASFLLGAVLSADITAIKQSTALALVPDSTIVIAGKAALQQALSKLIRRDPFFCGEVITVSEDPQRPLSAEGALAVLELIPEAIL